MGALEKLIGRERQSARSQAIPKFFADHFHENSDGKLTLQTERQETAKEWISRANRLDDDLTSLNETLRSIASKIQADDEASQMAKRMLSDPHAGVVITLEEFKGQLDPMGSLFERSFL